MKTPAMQVTVVSFYLAQFVCVGVMARGGVGVYWPKDLREPHIQNRSYKETDPKVALKV